MHEDHKLAILVSNYETFRNKKSGKRKKERKKKNICYIYKNITYINNATYY